MADTARLCACGCGEEIKGRSTQAMFINREHKARKQYKYVKAGLENASEVRTCACGCGATFVVEGKNILRGKRYANDVCTRRGSKRVFLEKGPDGHQKRKKGKCEVCGALLPRAVYLRHGIYLACPKVWYPEKNCEEELKKLREKWAKEKSRLAWSRREKVYPWRETYCHQKRDGRIKECRKYGKTLGVDCYTGECFEEGEQIGTLWGSNKW